MMRRTFTLRRERDSNPWNAKRSTVFETAPIDHSGISPSIMKAKTEGFEPPKPFGLTVFKTAAIDHSAISPLQKYNNFRLVAFFY